MNITASYAGHRVLKPVGPDSTAWGVFRYEGLDGQFIAVGCLPPDILRTGLKVTLVGEWADTKYGRQFKVSGHSVCRPVGRDGVIAFLRQATGVGQATAEKLWLAHGASALDEAVKDGKALKKASRGRMSDDSADIAAAFLRERLLHQEGRLALVEMLAGLSFPRDLPEKVFDLNLPDPIQGIVDNPFWLMRFSGCSFPRCDRLRERLGLSLDMLPRRRAAVLHMFNEKQGDTWLKREIVAADAADLLNCKIPGADTQIDVLIDDGDLVERDGFVALAHAAKTEARICAILADRRWNPGEALQWPNPDSIATLSDHQRSELKRAFSNGSIAFLAGQAGSGKTWTAAAVIRRFINILAVAPTGKAAQRFKAVLREQGITWVHPTTAHKALQSRRSGSGSWEYGIDGKTQSLRADLLVIDEASMLDNDLALALLRGTSHSTLILVVGDPYQLPPVGRGALLRDWLELTSRGTSYKCGELTEIKRHDGQIVIVADQIRRGLPLTPTVINRLGIGWAREKNVELSPSHSDSIAAIKIRNLVRNVVAGKILLEDGRPAIPANLQVIVPNNSGSETSKETLNLSLQKLITGEPDTAVHETYLINDRVICLKNDHYPNAEDNQKTYVANGEQGIVVEFRDKAPVIQVEEQRIILNSLDLERQFDLAYAITCHRAQGSSWPIVAVVPGENYRAKMVTDRSWLYTATTRAEQLCIILSTKNQLEQICGTTRIWDRRTFVVETMEGYRGTCQP